MPTTVNGVGTTYYGKKNAESYAGVCDSCNNSTTLTDYETGYYFCIIFIPIIPLGRKMILGECPICTRHRAMPLAEWERVKEESISEGIDALSVNSQDAAKALELVGTYSAFKQYDKARELAAAIQASHPQNFDAMLTLGGWYEQMQMQAEADACFQRCLAIDFEHPSSKRIRCVTHLEKGELPEGKALALELFALDRIEHLGPMMLLAGVLQHRELHAETYDVYQQIVASVPEMKEDKEFCKEIRALEKQLGVTESIVPKPKFFGLFG